MDTSNRPAAIKSSAQTNDETWQSLIDAARGGCDVALGEISQRTSGYLLLVAQQRLDRRLHAKFGASDMVQKTQMEAYKSFDQFFGKSEAEYRSWIKRIVINNVIDESTRYKGTQSRNCHREVSIDSVGGFRDGGQLTASKIISRQETDQELEIAIRKLSPKQQQVINLKHRFGYSYAEIASQLQVSESTIRREWSRALDQLKTLLDSPAA